MAKGGQRKSLVLKLIGAIASGGGSTVVGLSIGSSSVKLAELKKTGKSWKLLHFATANLPEDAILNREVSNPIAIVEAIKTLLNKVKLKNKNVCSSLSGSALIVKRFTLESTSKKSLQDDVFWEAEQYLPFNINEVIMDYHLLSQTKSKKADVIFVAAKEAVLNSYTECIEDSGLNAKVMDVDFFALQNIFEANYPVSPTEAVAVVDIGACSMKVVVVHKSIPVFTKDSTTGGKNLTSEIQQHLGLSYADAEALKLGGSEGGVPQEVNDLVSIMADNLASEIKRSVDFYNASSTGAPLAYVLLTGGGAKLPDLSRIVEETIGIPTQIINPFNAISYDPAVFTQDFITEIAPIAAVPLGLALRAGAK